MNIIYKSRGKGKTTELVKLSASTNTPILCMSTAHIYDVAKELGVKIPTPIAVKDYTPFSHENILVDDAEYVLEYFIGKIGCMTISEE